MRLKRLRPSGVQAVLFLAVTAVLWSACGGLPAQDTDREKLVLLDTDVVVGDVDVATYCREAKESSVSLYRNREGVDAAFDNWHCDPGSVIDLDAACRFEYGDNAVARVRSRNNAATWQCIEFS